MTVYVDDMKRPATIGRGRPAIWSHLFADGPTELADFARQVGLRPEWLQNAGSHREHYDVTLTVRQLAISLGARAITYPSGVAELIEARRMVCQCKTLRECRWAQALADSENSC